MRWCIRRVAEEVFSLVGRDPLIDTATALEKAARAEQRKREKAERGPKDPNAVDPDIAHIVPGPQPVLEE